MEEARQRSRENYLKQRVAKQIEQLKGKITDKKLLEERGLATELEKIELDNLQKTADYVQKYNATDESLSVNLRDSTETGRTLNERLKSAGRLSVLQDAYATNIKKETTWENEKIESAYMDKTQKPTIFTLPPREDLIVKEIDYTEVQQSLPVFKYKKTLLDALVSNHVLVVVGDTGSGKSTQIPQYLLERSPNESVVCTQPRRVAAMSVAARVAEERHVELGFEVGYAVRFDDKTSEFTKIRYMTDGTLLREFLVDPLLSKYTTVMIDEAHERSISTDILLSLLKDLIQVRPEFRLVVASATLDAASMSDFYDKCPILTVPGRRFTVDINYTNTPVVDYEIAAIDTVVKIHTSTEIKQPCDILVFLTGQDEIDRSVAKINELISSKVINNIEALPLYSALPSERQSLIFKPAPRGTRKVIFSTNIAETSLTIDTVKYVIDCGLVKEMSYDSKNGCSSLDRVPISKSSADQRAGRAGRTSHGICYRLYTESSFEFEHEQMTKPEIKRCDFAPTLLLLISMGITDIVNFNFVDSPATNNIISAYEQLGALQALDNDGNLTELGEQMSQLPVSPMCARAILKSFELGCSESVITICSVLESGSPLFYFSQNESKDAIAHIKQFYDEEGDHMMCLNVYNQWVDAEYSQQWCIGNKVQHRTLLNAKNIKNQLSDICQILNFVEDESKKNETSENISHAFCMGFFLNCAQLMSNGYYQTLRGQGEVKIHPSSCLLQYTAQQYLIFYELSKTTDIFMRTLMRTKPEWLREIAPRYFEKNGNGVTFKGIKNMK